MDETEPDDLGPGQAGGEQCGPEHLRQPRIEDELGHVGRWCGGGEGEDASTGIRDSSFTDDGVRTELDGVIVGDPQMGDRNAAGFEEMHEGAWCVCMGVDPSARGRRTDANARP